MASAVSSGSIPNIPSQFKLQPELSPASSSAKLDLLSQIFDQCLPETNLVELKKAFTSLIEGCADASISTPSSREKYIEKLGTFFSNLALTEISEDRIKSYLKTSKFLNKEQAEKIGTESWKAVGTMKQNPNFHNLCTTLKKHTKEMVDAAIKEKEISADKQHQLPVPSCGPSDEEISKRIKDPAALMRARMSRAITQDQYDQHLRDAFTKTATSSASSSYPTGYRDLDIGQTMNAQRLVAKGDIKAAYSEIYEKFGIPKKEISSQYLSENLTPDQFSLFMNATRILGDLIGCAFEKPLPVPPELLKFFESLIDEKTKKFSDPEHYTQTLSDGKKILSQASDHYFEYTILAFGSLIAAAASPSKSSAKNKSNPSDCEKTVESLSRLTSFIQIAQSAGKTAFTIGFLQNRRFSREMFKYFEVPEKPSISLAEFQEAIWAKQNQLIDSKPVLKEKYAVDFKALELKAQKAYDLLMEELDREAEAIAKKAEARTAAEAKIEEETATVSKEIEAVANLQPEESIPQYQSDYLQGFLRALKIGLGEALPFYQKAEKGAREKGDKTWELAASLEILTCKRELFRPSKQKSEKTFLDEHQKKLSAITETLIKLQKRIDPKKNDKNINDLLTCLEEEERVTLRQIQRLKDISQEKKAATQKAVVKIDNLQTQLRIESRGQVPEEVQKRCEEQKETLQKQSNQLKRDTIELSVLEIASRKALAITGKTLLALTEARSDSLVVRSQAASSTEVTAPQGSAVEVKNPRSKEAEELHTLIFDYCLRQRSLSDIEKQIEQHPSILEETSVNGYTHLMDAIHIFLENEKIAPEKIIPLIQTLLRNPSSRKFLLTTPCNENFSPLMQAVYTANPAIVQIVLNELHKLESPELLKTQLSQLNNENFSPLMQAVYTANPAIVQIVLNELHKLESPELLKTQLSQLNNENFSLLMTAVKSANPAIVQIVLNELHKFNDPELLKAQLSQLNNENFSPLMQAVYTANPAIVQIVLNELHKLESPELLKTQLSQLNNENFSLLMTAVKSANPAIVQIVLDELHKLNDPELLKAQLSQLNNENFSPLMQAVYTANPAIVQIVLNELHKLNDHELLKAQLSQLTNENFSLLLQAVKSANPDIVKIVLDELHKFNDPKLLKAQLSQLNNEDFSLLLQALKSANPDIVEMTLKELRKFPELLKAQLLKSTKAGFNIFHQITTKPLKQIGIQIMREFVTSFKEEAPRKISALLNPTKLYPPCSARNADSETRRFLIQLDRACQGGHKKLENFLSELEAQPKPAENSASSQSASLASSKSAETALKMPVYSGISPYDGKALMRKYITKNSGESKNISSGSSSTGESPTPAQPTLSSPLDKAQRHLESKQYGQVLKELGYLDDLRLSSPQRREKYLHIATAYCEMGQNLLANQALKEIEEKQSNDLSIAELRDRIALDKQQAESNENREQRTAEASLGINAASLLIQGKEYGNAIEMLHGCEDLHLSSPYRCMKYICLAAAYYSVNQTLYAKMALLAIQDEIDKQDESSILKSTWKQNLDQVQQALEEEKEAQLKATQGLLWTGS